MISIKQMRYALAVQRHLHFRKASEECAISQSAMSSALQEMESQLGFQVFERDNKKVLITPLGERFLDKARKVLVDVEDIMKIGAGRGSPLSGPLRMGMIPTIAPYLLPKLLSTLSAEYPALELSVTEAQSQVVVDQVRRGELDTAILALPYDCEGLLTFNFFGENFYWVAHENDEHAGQAVIQAEELRDSNLLLLGEGHCLKDHALEVCKLPRSSKHTLTATSLQTLVQMVAGGMGSTLVPEIALEQLVADNPRLICMPLDEPGPHRTLAFVVRPNYPVLDDIELIRTLIRSRVLPSLGVHDQTKT